MVIQMNKTKFIENLSHELLYPEEKCIIINDILENHFFLSKKNKEKIINEFITKLLITQIEAEKIYNTAYLIIKKEIKNKLKHPLKSTD